MRRFGLLVVVLVLASCSTVDQANDRQVTPGPDASEPSTTDSSGSSPSPSTTGAPPQPTTTTVSSSSSSTDPVSESGDTSTPRRVIPPSTTEPVSGTYLSEEIVEAVKDQAVEESGVDRTSLSVAVAAQVTWSDGSLGCPQEGQAYVQVLTDGYWVVLMSPAGELDYRSGEDMVFRRCSNGAPPATTYVDR